MSKPADLFRWATGVNRVTPPDEGKKTSGWSNAEMPPPKVMNWLFNGAYQWFGYLSNLENEPDFLGKIYRWTARHEFKNGILANAVGLYNTGEVYYLDAAGAFSPRTRVVTVPWLAASHGQPSLASSGASVGQAGATDVGAGVLLIKNGTYDSSSAHSSFPVVIPQGATLTGWKVLCVTNAQNFNFQFELKSVDNDFATPGLGTPARVGTLQSQSGVASTTYVKGQAGLSQLMVAGRQMWIEANVTSDPAPPSTYELFLAGVELTYTELRGSGSH